MTESDRSRVLDGHALIEAFKKEHGIKSNDLAKSLMFIETFRPEPKSEIPTRQL